MSVNMEMSKEYREVADQLAHAMAEESWARSLYNATHARAEKLKTRLSELYQAETQEQA